MFNWSDYDAVALFMKLPLTYVGSCIKLLKLLGLLKKINNKEQIY